MSSQSPEASSLEVPCSMQDLCQALTTEFERDPKGPGIAALLATYSARSTSWQAYTNYRAAEYTRHLIHKTASYELLLLSWSAGQESPIHSHMAQHCWMAVLEGIIEELQYSRPSAPGPLLPGKATALTQGQVAYIHDDIALHLVRPVAAHAASLHLYAKPYAACHTYDPLTGAESLKNLVYHATHARILPVPIPATHP